MGPMAAAGPQAPAPNCPPSGPFINVLFLNWWVMACHTFHWVLDRALSLTNPIFKQSLPCSFPSSFAYSDLCFPQEYLEGGAFQSTVTFGFALTCFFGVFCSESHVWTYCPVLKKGVGLWDSGSLWKDTLWDSVCLWLMQPPLCSGENTGSLPHVS